jgi:hypothetical protein
MRPKEILKTAVFKGDLREKNYIYCQPCSVTGFEWRLIGGNSMNARYDYCIVRGADPESIFNLKYEFMTAGNIFVFYVLEQKEYYSEILGEQCIEYIVDGWDVLYPVKHGSIFDGIIFSKHITIDDIKE